MDTYEKVETVKAEIRAGHTSNVIAVARRLCSGSEEFAASSFLSFAFMRVHRYHSSFTAEYHQLRNSMCAIRYVFDSTLKDMLLAFKAARYFSPHRLKDIEPNAEAINSIKAFLFLDSLNDLKQELPSYQAKVIDLDPAVDILQWWHRNEHELSCWAAAARKILLVQPSSAASEQVFSLLKSSFSSRQQKSLQDYIEVSLMLQYFSH